MILTFLLNLISAFVYGFLELFPTGTLPFDLSEVIATGYSYAMAFDRYLPITEMFDLFYAMMAIYLIAYGVKGGIFIINWIRGR